jgi:hypothetical protein
VDVGIKDSSEEHGLERREQREKVERIEMKDIVSKEEMQEFIEASLSGVSSFLGGIINEEDIDEEKVEHMNSQIMEKEPDYLYVRELKNQKKENSLRETASKFMKRAMERVD